MSSEISIGSISADVTLDLSGLQSSLDKATSLINTVSEVISSGLSKMLTEVEERFTQTGVSAQAMGEKIGQSANVATEQLGQVGTAAQAAGEKVSQSSSETTAQAERFNEQLTMTTAKLETLKGIDPLAELRASFRGLVPDTELEKLASLRNEINEVKSAEQNAANEAREMERAQVQAFQESEQAATKMRSHIQAAGAACQMVGQQMSQAGHEILGALADCVRTTMTFEEAMRNANSVAGMSEKELQGVRTEVLELAKDPRVTDGPNKLAQGLYQVYSAGYKGREGLQLLKDSAMGAAAGLAKTEDVTKAVIGIMGSHIKGVKDSASAVNLLVSEVNIGIPRLPELAKSIARVLAPAAKLGVTMQELTASQATLTSLAHPLAQSNTGLMNLMNKIISPTKAQADAMDQLGIAYGSTALKGRTWGAWLEDSMAKMKAFAAVHKTITIGKSTFKVTGPIDLSRRVMPLSQAEMAFYDLAAHTGMYKSKEAVQEKSDKGEGTSKSVLAEQLKSPAKQLASFQAQIEALKIQVGDILAVALNPLLGWAQKAATYFMELPQPVKTAAVVFAAIAGVALTVGGALLAFAGNAIMLTGALEAAGVTGAGVAAVLTGPIGLAIAGITLVVAGLVLAWKNDWGQIREHTQAFVQFLTPYLTTTWNAIKSAAQAGWSEIKDFISRVWPPIHDIVVFTWNIIQTILTGGMAILERAFRDTWGNLVSIVSGAWNLIAGVVKTLWAIVAGIITVGLDLITGRWGKAWDDIKHYAGMAWDGIKQAVSGGWDFIKGVFTGAIRTIVNIVMGAGHLLYNAGTSLMDGLKNGIQAGLGAVKGAASNVASATSNTFKSALGIQSPSKVFHEHGLNVAQGLANGIADGEQHVTRAMRHMASEHKKQLKEMAKDAKEVADAITAAYDHIYEMSHSKSDVSKREAGKQRDDRIATDPSNGKLKAAAEQEYALRMKEIAKEQADEDVKRGQAAVAHNNELTKTMLDGIAKRAAAETAATQKEDAERQKQLADNDAMFARVTAGFKHEQDNQTEYERATGKISLEQFRALLEEKLTHLRRFSDDWMTVWKQVQDTDKALDKQSDDAIKAGLDKMKAELTEEAEEQAKVAADFQAKWGQALQTTQGLLENAFINVMNGKFKNLFSDILRGWIQMLEQMVAKAIAMGIINLLTGGAGGFVGQKGGGGFLGAFGFDDWSNDAHAKNWGFDFQNLFMQGASEARTQKGPGLSGSGSHGAGGDVHIHMTGDNHYHNDTDARSVGSEMARQVQVKLRMQPGTG